MSISSTADYDAFVQQLECAGVGHEAAVRDAYSRLGRPPATIATRAVDDAQLEKAIEHVGDLLMQELGFEVIRFSHPGKTKQTEGIADRRYYRRPKVVERDGA